MAEAENLSATAPRDRPGTAPEAPSVEAADASRPGTAPAKSPAKKQPTLLSDILGRSDGGVGMMAPDSRTARSINQDISDKIAHKYGEHVVQADAKRRSSLMPLEELSAVKPDEIDMAKTMKSSMDNVLGLSAGGGGWDSIIENLEFQKQLQFLNTHARTGYFTEVYGADGQYEGDFLYGMRHGQGTHEFRGEVYEGQWKWDQRHGNGTLTKADGSQIRGEWQKGKPHGYVTITETKDDPKGKIVYEGFFKDGKRDGLGEQVFESGDIYNGGWMNGKLHDRGVYYFANGDKFIGMWKEGLYDGVGVFHYTDGSMSRRVYRDGILMSLQDMDSSSQRYGRALTREGMQKHTRDKEFPRDVFLLDHFR